MMNSHGCSLKASKLRTQNLLKRFHDLAGCLGCLAHICALNSSSRCFSYFSTISAIESPIGDPVGLNCHEQSEHAQPRKRSFSTQTNSRAIARFYNGVSDL
jgi:hypothetical protein